MEAESIAKPRTIAAFALVAAVGFCACDPVVNVAGANFPAWLVCALVGALIAALMRSLFIALRIHAHLWPAALVYVSLAMLMACVVYLIFFNRMWS
jgi:hypothetical protein